MSNVFRSEASVVTYYYCVCMSYDRSLRLHYSLLAVQFSKKKIPVIGWFPFEATSSGLGIYRKEKEKERKKELAQENTISTKKASTKTKKVFLFFLSVFLDAFLVESVFS